MFPEQCVFRKGVAATGVSLLTFIGMATMVPTSAAQTNTENVDNLGSLAGSSGDGAAHGLGDSSGPGGASGFGEAPRRDSSFAPGGIITPLGPDGRDVLGSPYDVGDAHDPARIGPDEGTRFNDGPGADIAGSDFATGVGSEGDEGEETASQSEDEDSATIELSRSSGLNPEGDTITVKGFGFKTTGHGVYVGLGQDGETDHMKSETFHPGTVWVSNTPGKGTAQIDVDGSFEVELKVSAWFGKKNKYNCLKYACSVMTVAAHGSSDRSQDTEESVSFDEPLFAGAIRPPAPTPAKLPIKSQVRAQEQARAKEKAQAQGHGKPGRAPAEKPVANMPVAAAPRVSGPHTVTTKHGVKVSVSKVNALDPDGEIVTVSGSGFATTGNGVYVGIAQQDQADFMDAESFSDSAVWVSNKKGNLNSDGSFSVPLQVSAYFGDANCVDSQCAIYTFAAHGSPDRSQDAIIPVNFVGGVEAKVTDHNPGRNAGVAAPVSASRSLNGGGSGNSAAHDSGHVADDASGPSPRSSGSGFEGASQSSGKPGSPHGAKSGGKSPKSGKSSKDKSAGKPRVTLSETELNPEGLTPITVSGSGFKTSGAGVYVGVAEKAKFSHTDASVYGAVAFIRSSEMGEDGSWEKTLQVDAIFEGGNCLVNQCAMFTLAAHGSSDRSQDTATDLTIKGGEKAAKAAQKKAEKSGRADKAKAKKDGKDKKGKKDAKSKGKSSANGGAADGDDAESALTEATADSSSSVLTETIIGLVALIAAVGGATYYWWYRKRPQLKDAGLDDSGFDDAGVDDAGSYIDADDE